MTIRDTDPVPQSGMPGPSPFDPARYITDADDLVMLIDDAFASGNAGYIANAIGILARSEGMTALAAQTGVNRQALYAALSESGNPTLDTLVKVTGALGIRLRCERALPAAA